MGERRPFFKETPIENEQTRVDDAWRQIMESVDKDGDGRIDFEEFSSAINIFLD